MWVCSGTHSDSKPRFSSSIASGAGRMESVVKNMTAPIFMASFLPCWGQCRMIGHGYARPAAGRRGLSHGCSAEVRRAQRQRPRPCSGGGAHLPDHPVALPSPEARVRGCRRCAAPPLPQDWPAGRAGRCLDSGRREVAFYDTVAPATVSDLLPRCFAAEIAPDGAWHLLLEDLTDTHGI